MIRLRHIMPLLAVWVLVQLVAASAMAQVQNATSQLAAAREQLRAAQADLKDQEKRAKEDLASTDPQWAKLLADCASAQTHRDEVKNGLMASYLQSGEYADAQEAIKKAERRMIEMTDSRDTAQPEFESAVNAAWDARGKLRMLQRARVDEAPELKAAAVDLRHAEQVRDAYWANYVTTTLSHNPAWSAAIAKRDAATAAVSAAEEQVAQMRQQAAGNRPQRQFTPRSNRGGYSGRSGGSRRSSGMSRGY